MRTNYEEPAPAKSRNVEELIAHFKMVVGIPNVYYEPPENTKMKYPCVRFQRRRFSSQSADNINYIVHEQFEATLIYKSPDSPLPRRLLMSTPMCSHDRHYTADNLSHDVYIITK